jgi:hypothetical protein
VRAEIFEDLPATLLPGTGYCQTTPCDRAACLVLILLSFAGSQDCSQNCAHTATVNLYISYGCRWCQEKFFAFKRKQPISGPQHHTTGTSKGLDHAKRARVNRITPNRLILTIFNKALTRDHCPVDYRRVAPAFTIRSRYPEDSLPVIRANM